MKLILSILLLSNILFAVQKQVILGSYSVKENAANELVSLNKHIENDSALKELMDKYSLRTMNTVISGYTVVSVNYFDSYIAMDKVMSALQARNGDMFSLKYPTRGIGDKEYVKDVKAKAMMELAELKKAQLKQAELAEAKVKAEEKAKAEEKIQSNIVHEQELVVIEEVNTPEEELKQKEESKKVLALRTQNIEKMKLLKIAKENQLKNAKLKEEQQKEEERKIEEEQQREVEQQLLEEQQEEEQESQNNVDVVKEDVSQVNPQEEVKIEETETLTSIDNKKIIEDKDVGLESYYIIIGLIFLILIIGGFIISRQFFQKI